MQFQLLRIETQSVQICWTCTTFRYNQTQFRRVEVPSLGHHMVSQRLSDLSYELERTISHSNITIYKHWNKEKILKKFENEYFKQPLRKNVSMTCVFNQRNLRALFTSHFLLYSNVHKNRHSNVCLKFLCGTKLISPLFIFKYF